MTNLIPQNGHRDRLPHQGRTKACIGYAMAEHMRTELVIAALDMAARNHCPADGVIFHSDCGTRYTSVAFADATNKLGIRRSVGRTGVCFDNAQAESCNAALKVERVNRTIWRTLEPAGADICPVHRVPLRYQRLHSGLGRWNPKEVHDEYLNRRHAA